MRKITVLLAAAVTAAAMTICPALSLEVTLEQDVIYAGETARAQAQGADSVTWYARCGDIQAVGREAAPAACAYVPLEPGAYVLCAETSEGERAEAALTVLPKAAVSLSAQCADGQIIASAACGETRPGARVTLHFSQENVHVWQMSAPPDGTPVLWTPPRAGQWTVTASMADESGVLAADSQTVEVKEAARDADDETAAPAQLLPAQGGAQSFTVSFSGVWTARALDDFITLQNDCGLPGDKLTVVLDATEAARAGVVEVTCAGQRALIRVKQSSLRAPESDIPLYGVPESISANGQAQLSWVAAQGEKTFAVQASAPWTAQSDDDFTKIDINGDQMTISLKGETDETRACVVTLACGTARAYVHVFQLPETRGANVLYAEMDKAAGMAYEDAPLARVTTTADAAALRVISGGQADAYAPDRAITQTDGTLLWTIPVTLRETGAVLFEAVSADGAGARAALQVTVTPQPEGVVSASAQNRTVTAVVTAATRTLLLLDEKEKTIGEISREDAAVDEYVSESNQGRYASWSFQCTDIPAAVRAGGRTIAVTAQARLTPDVIYDQSSGMFRSAPYRKSTLQVSGCAIFALAHALDLLGFTGDAARPEPLADAYAFCLVDGGTLNSTLVGNAGDDFGFKTRYELLEDAREVKARFQAGAVFSFSVVAGHIALATGLSENGDMVRVVDSAPSATFERMTGTDIFDLDEYGAFQPVTSPAQLGADYYFEYNAYGGCEYWLPLSYLCKRGARLIQLR